MEMDKITVTVAAANRVELAGRLRAFADNLDGTPAGADGKVTKSTKTTKATAAAPVETEADEDDDFGKAEAKTKQTKAAKQAAASFEEGADDEETAAEPEAEVEADDFMEAPKTTKKSAAKKFTVNDVNDACKAKANATDRKTVLGILKKKFNVTSVTELKADQYADVIKAMAV